jgi:AcrR family transcriptional regulator
LAKTAANRSPRWERRSEARPGEIAEAAFELFLEKGFSATRIDDVAVRAGVSKGTIYLYFENKEALFNAAIDRAVLPNVARFEGLVDASEGTTTELIERLLAMMATVVTATPVGGVPKLIISEAGNFPELVEHYRDVVVLRIQGLMAALIRRGIDNGEIRSDIDPVYTGRILGAPIFLLAIVTAIPTFRDAWKIDPSKHAAETAKVILHGLVPRNKNEARS